MEAQTPGDDDAKMTEVQEALEAMLSKKNLVKDQFLAGNMNPQMYIPIITLLQHEKLKIAGATEAAIIAAANKSTKLGIDEHQTMVRPLLKSKRNVVILREVPEGTTESDIFELFVGAPHADRITNVKPEVNNTWFVKFNLDSGTEDVVLWLRTQQIKGVPVNAAIKSEHFLRSFFPLDMAGGQGQPPMGYAPMDPSQMDPSQMAQMGQMVDPRSMGFIPMPMGMPPPPPPLQEGMQTAGFWQPWGQRYQAPPLIFTSATTLAPSSIPEPGQELPPLDFLEEFEEAEFGGKGGKGGKGSSWKGGGGKGKWNSGKDWSSASKGGSWWGSKDWSGTGGSWTSGGKGGGDSWSSGGKGGGDSWSSGVKGGGDSWSSGGKGGGDSWSSGGKGGGGGGWAGGGKAALSLESYGGDDGNSKDWYAASSGKDWYAASSGGKGGGEQKWVPKDAKSGRWKG